MANQVLRLLDTNIISLIVRGGHPAVDARLVSAAPGTLYMSAITRAELRYGVCRKPSAHRLAQLVNEVLIRIPSLDWNHEAADTYGALRAELERRGTPIGNLDTLIAAHALAIGATLVTANRRHFEMVPDLAIEDWSAG
jgi:tRNA(fMet)-specific endonuclease VapC